MQNIPLPAWQQISIVIVFSFLALGQVWGVLRMAERAFGAAADSFGRQLDSSNRQWQAYFDARAEAAAQTQAELLRLLRQLANAQPAPAAKLKPISKARPVLK